MSIGEARHWSGDDDREFGEQPEQEDDLRYPRCDLGSTETYLVPNSAEKSEHLSPQTKKAAVDAAAQKENEDEREPF